MAQRRLALELPDALFDELCRVTEALGLTDATAAATVAITDWVARRKAELDDRDPAQRYFINEALDELARKKS